MGFAIISTWPDIKNAEYECIERLKIAAKNIQTECYLIDMDGYLIDDNKTHISTINNVSFCLALHFLNTKIHNLFTYAVLWNPPQFIDDWGNERMSKNIVSCDDFLCYPSQYMLTFYNNLIGCFNKKIDPSLEFVPSIPESLVIPPRQLNDKFHLFYSGINWERIGNMKGRHHALFKLLDKDKCVAFYGPEKFLGERPWAGFSCYRGSLPFDGASTIKAISDCGVSLVLSSNVHRLAGAPTSRLYESAAAGAVIISDENAFVQEVFGDSVLSFTYDKDPAVSFKRIKNHIEWIKKNPLEAKKKAEKSQAIFLERFSMEKELKNLIGHHEERKKIISDITCANDSTEIIDVIFTVLKGHELENIKLFERLNSQTHKNIHLILIAPTGFTFDFAFRTGIQVDTLIRSEKNTHGQDFAKALELMQGSRFCFMQLGYEWSDEHLALLNKPLQDNDCLAAHTAYFCERENKFSRNNIKVRRELCSTRIKYSNVLHFNNHTSAFLFLFKKELATDLAETFRFFDDFDKRHITTILLIECIKRGNLGFTNHPSVLISYKTVKAILAEKREIIPDHAQFSFAHKKYMFDEEFHKIVEHYPLPHSEKPPLPPLKKQLGKFLRENIPFLYKLARKFYKYAFSWMKEE